MIDTIIQGKLYGAPKTGTGRNGNTYTTAKLRVATAGGDTLMVSVIVFDEAAQHVLQALADGDAVAMTGTLTPKVFQAKDGTWRPGLDLVAQAVMSPYQVRHKRAVVGKTGITEINEG
ncbi:MAG: single-stranded DNA-binding protein [Castellaniella sp.]|uniref:single-stranded DNA-binding protein n=1 Tax=Castellaniella sp. TaxID=1955812 RepID=UPI001208D96F|nr:single-stranded DNA-binding protein [Castellaniella sp.]TAN26038.1 MAG: single-stranded DNA-binding protein [Castellaniella sp.]